MPKLDPWTRAALNYKIVTALRKVYFQWPIRKTVLSELREETTWTKKDGSQAVRPKVLYTCESCKEKVNSSKIKIDHIDPVVPLDGQQKWLGTEKFTWDNYIARLFCDVDNLWAICEECHNEKTRLENTLRREWGKYFDGKHDKAPEIRRIGKDFKTYTILDTGYVGKRP